MFQEAREGVDRLGAELLRRLVRGGEVGDDGGEGAAGEVLHAFVPQTKNKSKSVLGCVAADSLRASTRARKGGWRGCKNAPLFGRRDCSAGPCR